MSKKVIVLGAGGHAKVVIELLRSSGYQVDYCVGGAESSNNCMGVPVLSGDIHLNNLREDGYSLVFPAIGSNALRARLGRYVVELGYSLVNAISPAALISPSVKLGCGVAVMAGAVINAESEICDLAIINTGAVVDHDCHIGFAAHCAPRTALAGCVRVGNLVFLGIGASVIPGVTIGENSIVGAGAAVVCDIPCDAVAVGVPARIMNTKEHRT